MNKELHPIFSHTKILLNLIFKLFFLFIAIIGALAITTTGVNARTFICESHSNQTQHCPADTVGGVQLLRQLSESDCREGQTWGYDRQGIWVSRGCRAEFETENYRSERYSYDNREDNYWQRDDHPRRQAPSTITC